TLKNAWTTSRQVNFFWVANFNLKFGLLIGITNYARFKNLRLTVVFSVPFLFNAIMSIINSF
ncbi:hypothetical protein RK427_04600, partial [Streptococcus pneumoniae]|nr:hypothetical protein [Streptococcus pneumoniae]